MKVQLPNHYIFEILISLTMHLYILNVSAFGNILPVGTTIGGGLGAMM